MYDYPTTRRPTVAAVDRLIDEGRRVEAAARRALAEFGPGVFGIPPLRVGALAEWRRASRMEALARLYHELSGGAR